MDLFLFRCPTSVYNRRYINSGIEVQNFFYKGDIFRIHPPTTTMASRINSKIEFQSGPICIDGSCSVLPITRYEDTMRGFGKSYDFTRRDFHKINQSEKAVFLHCNTGNMYGIDINSLAKSIGCLDPKFEYEKEVLSPIQKEYIIKEYICTPIEFKIKMENYFTNGEIVPRRS